MKTKIENHGFLEAGIKRYEEARDTIIAFERQMETLLEEAATNRHDWKPLIKESVQVGHASANRSEQYGYWIAIDIKGKSPWDKQVELDTGFWWKWSKVGCPFIYASYRYDPKRVEHFVWNGKNSDICAFSDWKRTFLYLPLKKPADIKTSWNRLIDALLKQLKKP